MERWTHQLSSGHYYEAFIGTGTEFTRQTDGASAELQMFGDRQVVWLEMLSGRGSGAALLDHLKQRARHAGVRFILLQVVPVPWSEEGGKKLVDFYRRQGFWVTTLAPWSDFPVMMTDLQRSFVGVT